MDFLEKVKRGFSNTSRSTVNFHPPIYRKLIKYKETTLNKQLIGKRLAAFTICFFVLVYMA